MWFTPNIKLLSCWATDHSLCQYSINVNNHKKQKNTLHSAQVWSDLVVHGTLNSEPVQQLLQDLQGVGI